MMPEGSNRNLQPLSLPAMPSPDNIGMPDADDPARVCNRRGIALARQGRFGTKP